MVSSYRSHARVAQRCGWCALRLCVLSKQRKASQHILLLSYTLAFSYPVIGGMCEIVTAKCTFYVLSPIKRVEHFSRVQKCPDIFPPSWKNVQQKIFTIKTSLITALFIVVQFLLSYCTVGVVLNCLYTQSIKTYLWLALTEKHTSTRGTQHAQQTARGQQPTQR